MNDNYFSQIIVGSDTDHDIYLKQHLKYLLVFLYTQGYIPLGQYTPWGTTRNILLPEGNITSSHFGAYNLWGYFTFGHSGVHALCYYIFPPFTPKLVEQSLVMPLSKRQRGNIIETPVAQLHSRFTGYLFQSYY